MALDLHTEHRLEDAGLVKFYQDNAATWNGFCKQAYDFVVANFPKGSKIRRDDVAKTLVPLIEVDESFNNFKAENKLPRRCGRAFSLT